MSEEVTPFSFDAGNLALDLVNTLRVAEGESSDPLRSPADLSTWLRACGLAPSDSRPDSLAAALRAPPSARLLLAETKRLRDDVAEVVLARKAGRRPPPHALYGINRVLAASRVSTSVLLEGHGARIVESERGESLLAHLVPVARAAADLLTVADPDRIRPCASDTCRRWFLDTSKGGRRKWCSMATCGNRAKAASHRRRRATA